MLNSRTINFPDSIILRFSVLLLFLLSSAVQAQTPRSPEDYLKRGVARYDKGNYDGAIADFDRAIEINSAHSNGGNDARLEIHRRRRLHHNNERIAVLDH